MCYIQVKNIRLNSFYEEKKIKLCLTKQLLNMFKLWCEWGIIWLDLKYLKKHYLKLNKLFKFHFIKYLALVDNLLLQYFRLHYQFLDCLKRSAHKFGSLVTSKSILLSMPQLKNSLYRDRQFQWHSFVWKNVFTTFLWGKGDAQFLTVLLL